MSTFSTTALLATLTLSLRKNDERLYQKWVPNHKSLIQQAPVNIVNGDVLASVRPGDVPVYDIESLNDTANYWFNGLSSSGEVKD